VPLALASLAEPVMHRVARLNGSQPLYTRAMLTALQSNRQISHARAGRDLGYAPRQFQETLQDTLTWLMEHHHRVENFN
jgi:dihydroflavonol-4-reductase